MLKQVNSINCSGLCDISNSLNSSSTHAQYSLLMLRFRFISVLFEGIVSLQLNTDTDVFSINPNPH